MRSDSHTYVNVYVSNTYSYVQSLTYICEHVTRMITRDSQMYVSHICVCESYVCASHMCVSHIAHMTCDVAYSHVCDETCE